MGIFKQETTNKGGSFIYEEDGKKGAEMVYVNSGDKKLIIEHTDVEPSLQGKGIGKQLLGKLLDYVRSNKIKVLPLCPFAKATFKKKPEWQDVLSNYHVKLK